MEPFSPEQVEFFKKAAVTLLAVEEAPQNLLLRVEKTEPAIKEHPETISKKIYENLKSDTTKNEVILYVTENRVTKAASTAETSIKVRNPDTFSGKPSACSNFFLKLALVFSTSPDKFNTDSSKIPYVISYLTGTPLSYMEPYLMKANLPESDRPTILFDYTLFKETITCAFGDPNPIEIADRAIRQLRQTTSVAAYATEFLSGLKFNVSQEIKITIQIENRLFSNAYRLQPPVNSSSFIPLKKTSQKPFASPVTTATKPPEQNNDLQKIYLSTAPSSRRPPLTPAQRAYHI
ncbi:hypothetical protein AYI68_g8002 [Smittium mucronatum]|uniref:Retrotransposon gag domain-containing protein n=1 Tax=Smittium mucronatum TaxID=133383 RepID=A0A1R0GM62_9FUNG|nr:hypothetical protein AYI68_g8002 [Smittium mucronatum]